MIDDYIPRELRMRRARQKRVEIYKEVGSVVLLVIVSVAFTYLLMLITTN